MASRRTDRRRTLSARAASLRLCLLLLGLAACTSTSAAQEAPPDDARAAEVPPPWRLSALGADEPSWAGLLRLRAEEAAYRASERWWGTYAQLRAQEEAAVGAHSAALRYWDAFGPRRDSVGVLPEGVRAADALGVLAAAADTARVVMINERHHAASDRLLTLRLLPVLYDAGFRYFAAEAFDAADAALNDRAYPTAETGYYTREPVFAYVVREALRLGYTLVPYEMTPAQHEGGDADGDDLTSQQRRDLAQAQNLAAATVRADPDARVLVHAGFAHVEENARENWHPMALYFRELTGIDPLTVDQTALSERSTPAHEHPAYRAAADAGLLAGAPVVLLHADGRPFRPARPAVDLQVLTPRTTYTAGRPDWMSLGRRRVPFDVAVPECRDRWCMVLARAAGEPDGAVALDRAEADSVGSVRLFVPPDVPVAVRVFAADGALLRSIPAEAARAARGD